MSKKVRFTANRISQFECPPDKQQSFIWDSSTQGLGLRKTPRGNPSYIFQSRFNGKSIRISIGSPKVWSIGDAQQKARELQRQIDQGQDPRQIRARLQAEQQRDQAEKKLQSATFGEVFSEYIEHRKDSWGERHYLDHVGMIASGKRGKAGVLRPFVERKLSEIDSEAVEELMSTESSLRPARARLALRHLRALFTWASEHKIWKQVVQPEAAASRDLRRLVGSGEPRTDYIKKEQLESWFTQCECYPNQITAAYLQILLLTGARREELARLRWEEVDFQWNVVQLGVSNRIRAYETFHGITLPSSFRIVTDRLSLFSLEAEEFAEAIVQENLHGGVIVVDTMAQSAPGSDENSSADMGTIISNSQLLQRITGGLVILIHHTGKDARRGARGHSSLEGALDTGIEVKRSLSGREWRKAKVKDGEADSSYTFHLKMVDLGIDSDGDPITSCVAVGDLFRASQRLEPKGKNQKLVLEALQGVFVEGESISENELMRLAKEAVGGSRNQLQRAKEAVTSLRKIDRIVPAEGGYQLV